MAGLLQFLAASVVVLLPRQYRRSWPWGSDEGLRGPAIFSGLAEAVISLMIVYDLSIASCRPKPAWNRMTTIQYSDEFYELYEQRTGAPPRPYLYQLRKLTPGRMIRGIHRYHPHEALTEKQRREIAREEMARKESV